MQQAVAAGLSARAGRRNLVAVVSALPLLAAALAPALYATQGGFSADGPYDAVITALTAPWSVWLDYLSTVPGWVIRHELLAAIWFPALLNSAVFFLVALLVAGVLRARKAA